MSASNPTGWKENPQLDYVTVVARREIGPRVALWERDPDQPNGEVIVEGAEADQPLRPVRVARTPLVNDRLHPRVESGGTLRIVEDKDLAETEQAWQAKQDAQKESARAALEQRAQDGDVSAALMLSLQGGTGSAGRSSRGSSSDSAARKEADAAIASRDQQLEAQAAEIEALRAQLAEGASKQGSAGDKAAADAGDGKQASTGKK